MGATSDAPLMSSKRKVPTIRSFKPNENAPALRPGLIDGGSAIGAGGQGQTLHQCLCFWHYEVSNKRKSVVRRSYPLTIFLVGSSSVGQVPGNDPG